MDILKLISILKFNIEVKDVVIPKPEFSSGLAYSRNPKYFIVLNFYLCYPSRMKTAESIL